jgi:hypothetical protein
MKKRYYGMNKLRRFTEVKVVGDDEKSKAEMK